MPHPTPTPEDPPSVAARDQAASARLAEADAWFVREVLPLQPALMRLFRRHWRDVDDHADFLQDVLVRAYESALSQGFPGNPTAFVFTIARHLLVDQARRRQIVSFQSVQDLEDPTLGLTDSVTPERVLQARESLRCLAAAVDALPPRCRQALLLRKVDGLSQKEIAKAMGVAEGTVEGQIALGLRTIAAALAKQHVEEARTWLGRVLALRRKP